MVFYKWVGSITNVQFVFISDFSIQLAAETRAKGIKYKTFPFTVIMLKAITLVSWQKMK